MDDDGFLRSPKWIRAWPEEDRFKNAKIPKAFREHVDPSVPLPKGAEEWLATYERGDLLLIGGRNGVMSARKAANILGALIRRGESGRWVSSDGYVELYKDEWGDDGEGRLWRELKYIARGYDVVVIDGLGEEPNTEFERKVIATLIRNRVEHGLTTIVTTPLTPVELAQYSGRIGYYFETGTKV